MCSDSILDFLKLQGCREGKQSNQNRLTPALIFKREDSNIFDLQVSPSPTIMQRYLIITLTFNPGVQHTFQLPERLYISFHTSELGINSRSWVQDYYEWHLNYFLI